MPQEEESEQTKKLNVHASRRGNGGNMKKGRQHNTMKAEKNKKKQEQ